MELVDKVKCKNCSKQTSQWFDCLVGEEEPYDDCPFQCEHCKMIQSVNGDKMWRL